MFHHWQMNPMTDLEHIQNSQYWTKGSLLGRGRFADVYLYTRNTTHFAIAVKEVKFDPNNKNASHEMKALSNEISIYETVSHERIMTYLGSQTDNSNHVVFICLEYLPGGSLYSQLQEKGPLDLNATVKNTRQILEGVAYLHQQKIIHRDIKGQNVLIDIRNNVKLADFGISKQLETLSSTQGAKTEGVGTFNWMAPEIICGQEYGFKVDIWSIGCTIVEMLTTNPPWRNLTNFAIINKISNKEYPTYDIPKSCDEVEDLLRQCFQTDPKYRPSAKELLTTKVFRLSLAIEPRNAEVTR